MRGRTRGTRRGLQGGKLGRQQFGIRRNELHGHSIAIAVDGSEGGGHATIHIVGEEMELPLVCRLPLEEQSIFAHTTQETLVDGVVTNQTTGYRCVWME